MKKLVYLSAIAIFISSCSISNEELFEDYHSAMDEFRRSEIRKLLAGDFIFMDPSGRSIDKLEYLDKIDSFEINKIRTSVLSMNVDSIITTTEEVVSIVDSILGVFPRIKQKKTYHFENGKIKMITVDSILNQVEYNRSRDKKVVPFEFYLKNKFAIDGIGSIAKEIEKHWREYGDDPNKNAIILIGTWKAVETALWNKLHFHDENNVTIFSFFEGISAPTTYKTIDKSILIYDPEFGSNFTYKMIDVNTLQGPGGGFYKRLK